MPRSRRGWMRLWAHKMRQQAARHTRCIPASPRSDSSAHCQLSLGLAGKIGVYCGVRNNWDLGHSERTMNAKKIAVVSLLVAVVALAACRREECCRPLKLGAGDVAAAELAR